MNHISDNVPPQISFTYPQKAVYNTICANRLINLDCPVWLRNRLIFTGLEPVLSHTEKLCIVLDNLPLQISF